MDCKSFWRIFLNLSCLMSLCPHIPTIDIYISWINNTFSRPEMSYIQTNSNNPCWTILSCLKMHDACIWDDISSCLTHWIKQLIKATLSQHRSEVYSDKLMVEVSPKWKTVSSATYQKQFWLLIVCDLRAEWVEHQRPRYRDLETAEHTVNKNN